MSEYNDLARFAEQENERRQSKRRSRCGLCSLPEARKAALQWWEGGGSSTIIAAWLRTEHGLDRAPRTIRDCLNKHKGV